MLVTKSELRNQWLRIKKFVPLAQEAKLCFLMVDNGSTENFVSKEMVTKLGLKLEQISKLYKISWFREGNLMV